MWGCRHRRARPLFEGFIGDSSAPICLHLPSLTTASMTCAPLACTRRICRSMISHSTDSRPPLMRAARMSSSMNMAHVRPLFHQRRGAVSAGMLLLPGSASSARVSRRQAASPRAPVL